MQLDFFNGTSQSKLDAKARCSFPREFRKFLDPIHDNSVVVVVDPEEKALRLYPVLVWKRLLERWTSQPLSPKASLSLRRLQASAKPSTLDVQNRISLSAEQMRWAGISDTVVFFGLNDMVFLYSPEKFAALQGIDGPEDQQEFREGFYELQGWKDLTP